MEPRKRRGVGEAPAETATKFVRMMMLTSPVWDRKQNRSASGSVLLSG